LFSSSHTSAAEHLLAAEQLLQVKELVQQLDPLITPILNPFVEGLQTPINKVGGSSAGNGCTPSSTAGRTSVKLGSV